LKNGELLGGRYELAEVLGQGGMGEVRSARDLRLGRTVAIKTLRPGLAGRPEVRRRFEAEARSAARLTHPHVVAVHDVGEEDGVPFIVMERVSGPGLEQEMAAGPMDPDRVRQVGAGILAALGAAHAAGVVHRDVKPANVLLAADGAVKVADFGIAKALDNPDADGATAELDLTGDGQLVGTVAYMAPERVGGAPASVQSDLYSVGVILYEALSGTKPFEADTPMSLCWAVHQGDHDPLAARRPGLDPALVAVVERAMAHRPEDRFTTAADMAAALSETRTPAAADTAPTVSVGHETRVLNQVPLPAAAPAPPSRRRTPWPVVLAVAALCLLAAWFDSGLGGHGEPSRPAQAQPPAGSPATAAVPAGSIPAPLDDALSQLEEVVR
jgi:serine/threonine-protein kinase